VVVRGSLGKSAAGVTAVPHPITEGANHELGRQTAIVTGAGSGIGFAVADSFVRDGVNVVLNRRNEPKFARGAAQIGQPDPLAIVVVDVTRPETADHLIAAAVRRFGRVDILVSNAGIFHTKPFTAYTVEELDSFVGYLRGTFVLSQAAVGQMRKQGGGVIINIGTTLAANGRCQFVPAEGVVRGVSESMAPFVLYAALPLAVLSCQM